MTAGVQDHLLFSEGEDAQEEGHVGSTSAPIRPAWKKWLIVATGCCAALGLVLCLLQPVASARLIPAALLPDSVPPLKDTALSEVTSLASAAEDGQMEVALIPAVRPPGPAPETNETASSNSTTSSPPARDPQQTASNNPISFSPPAHDPQVNCGNHHAGTCAECPQGNGRNYCNRDCKWVQGSCLSTEDSALTDKFWALVGGIQVYVGELLSGVVATLRGLVSGVVSKLRGLVGGGSCTGIEPSHYYALPDKSHMRPIPSPLVAHPSGMTMCDVRQLQQDCVAQINTFRAGGVPFSDGRTRNHGHLDAVQLAPEDWSKCMNEKASSDLYYAVHKGQGCGHFTNTLDCGLDTFKIGSENSCCPRNCKSYNGCKQALLGCLNQMWDEGKEVLDTGKTGWSMSTGHYWSITRSGIKYAVCGFGFDSQGGMLATQNFF